MVVNKCENQGSSSRNVISPLGSSLTSCATDTSKKYGKGEAEDCGQVSHRGSVGRNGGDG